MDTILHPYMYLFLFVHEMLSKLNHTVFKTTKKVGNEDRKYIEGIHFKGSF